MSTVVLAAGTGMLSAQQDASRGIRVVGREPGSRVALVIGNGEYESSPLSNPINDAADMAAALESSGFEVIRMLDQDLRGMKNAVRDFARLLRRSEVGVFYYAGHGIELDGQNFLIPVGHDIQQETDVEFYSLNVGWVMAEMEEAGNPLSIVILDACRDNPFAGRFRSSNNGLASMDAPTGTILAYATAPGSVAADGRGRNGLYTQELLRYLRTPGMIVEQMFKRVRVSVMEASDGDQIPWESSSLTGDFYFTPTEELMAQAPSPEPADEDGWIEIVEPEGWQPDGEPLALLPGQSIRVAGMADHPRGVEGIEVGGIPAAIDTLPNGAVWFAGYAKPGAGAQSVDVVVRSGSGSSLRTLPLAVAEAATSGAMSVNDINRIFAEDLETSAGGLVSFTASESNQLSQESERWGGGHGVFTHFLLEGLRGQADEDGDGIVRLGEALQYTRYGVMRETRNAQIPSISSSSFDRFLPLAVAGEMAGLEGADPSDAGADVSRSAPPRGERFAVVIGVSEFRDPDVLPLQFADDDAQAMYDFLISPQAGFGGFDPENIVLLLNEQADYRAVRAAFYTFLQQATDEDLVLVYVAGHGIPDPFSPSDYYLLTHDAEADDLTSTAFPMREFTDVIARLNARDILVISDVSHAGGVGRSGGH